MIEIGSRLRNQAPPPRVVFEALVDPHRAGARPWLFLLDDEQEPIVLEQRRPDLVVWSSLWPRRPDAHIRFDVHAAGGGTDLRWTLTVDAPVPDDSLTGHLRARLNKIVNADLRYSFGQ